MQYIEEYIQIAGIAIVLWAAIWLLARVTGNAGAQQDMESIPRVLYELIRIIALGR